MARSLSAGPLASISQTESSQTWSWDSSHLIRGRNSTISFPMQLLVSSKILFPTPVTNIQFLKFNAKKHKSSPVHWKGVQSRGNSLTPVETTGTSQNWRLRQKNLPGAKCGRGRHAPSSGSQVSGIQMRNRRLKLHSMVGAGQVPQLTSHEGRGTWLSRGQHTSTWGSQVSKIQMRNRRLCWHRRQPNPKTLWQMLKRCLCLSSIKKPP